MRGHSLSSSQTPLQSLTLAIATCMPAMHAAAASAPPAVSVWESYERLDFTIDGRDCILVRPKTAAPGAPWIWRMEFVGHQPQADLALLARGYHLAYVDVQNRYGAPVALEHMDKFYAHVTTVYGLSRRVVLEGFSRGGLFSLNWAARHPAWVACIYNDAPVCDFKSWPAGRGRSQPSPTDWAALLDAYGLTEEEALAYRGNPVDNLAPLAQAKVPLLHICGEADEVVPIEENTALLAERYRQLGGEIRVISKQGIGHHPHSLEDPTPIVEFILKHNTTAP
ncbi:MAG: alpha/beta hydrolase [Pirellulales bacterium]|nr:alpha/beta hydrolase [Pirellulales bacterium]